MRKFSSELFEELLNLSIFLKDMCYKWEIFLRGRMCLFLFNFGIIINDLFHNDEIFIHDRIST